ncbi:MAG: IMP cyclohydrolase [Armatimonadota bacterium]|nr:IMP cyclohydrolase [Armatimonadota bacterium]
MYVGRIVVVGKTSRPFVAYRVSSRSFPNRVARITDGTAAIQPLDPEDAKKNPYITYNCIRVGEGVVVVSNGSHTDPIFEEIQKGKSPDLAMQRVLSAMGYEKDDYNTPRIAGVITGEHGFLGIVREDGLEIGAFGLTENTCRIICTYELNRLDNKSYPFTASTALEAARYVVEGGVFKEFENPVCAAAWMDELAVFNPHEQ